jgi:putative SOS response-associated peptidase YedK
MCGRYRLTSKERYLAEHFDVSDEVEWSPRYNIAPSDSVATIRQHATEPKRMFSKMRWGLVPSWAEDPSIGYKTINARSESVTEKPSYSDSFKKRRCLIPADGFYEWKKEGKEKQPFNFGMVDDSIFAFAGIWDSWRAPEGQVIETCSILTTTPNALVQAVHDRMPVILGRDVYDDWLDPALQDTTALAYLLKPFPAKEMRSYPVSQWVNSPKNDTPDCMTELELEKTAPLLTGGPRG